MRTLSAALALLGCVALVAGCPGGGTPDHAAPASPTTTPHGSFADSGAGADWTLYGHDLANTRLSAKERSVTAETVGTLRRRWSIAGLIGVTGTPMVSDGVAYFDDWTGTVRAV